MDSGTLRSLGAPRRGCDLNNKRSLSAAAQADGMGSLMSQELGATRKCVCVCVLCARAHTYMQAYVNVCVCTPRVFPWRAPWDSGSARGRWQKGRERYPLNHECAHSSEGRGPAPCPFSTWLSPHGQRGN